jgi:hypothetical protein
VVLYGDAVHAMTRAQSRTSDSESAGLSINAGSRSGPQDRAPITATAIDEARFICTVTEEGGRSSTRVGRPLLSRLGRQRDSAVPSRVVVCPGSAAPRSRRNEERRREPPPD